MYASTDQARDAGAVGTTAELTEAIERASERVERYTGDVFEPTPMTLQLTVPPSGLVPIPRRVISVTSVTWLGSPTPIAAAGYRVSSSSVRGAPDQLAMVGTLSWADDTILGAESWNGGWAGLSQRAGYYDPQLTVVGVFGWESVPLDVAAATALVAAAIRRGDRMPEGDTSVSVDSEGNVLPTMTVGEGDVQRAAALSQLARIRTRTTGDLQADALLASYVREPVRIRA
jgi:hypothetical protein